MADVGIDLFEWTSDYSPPIGSFSMSILLTGETYSYGTTAVKFFGADEIGITQSFTEVTSGFKFVAYPALDLNSIYLKWTRPSWMTEADIVRIQRSRWEYPRTELEGDRVYEGPLEKFLDTGLEDNMYYFYSMFILSDGSWYDDPRYTQLYSFSAKDYNVHGEVVDILPPSYFNHSEIFGEQIEVFGRALNIIRALTDSISQLFNGDRSHPRVLELFSHILGYEFEEAIGHECARRMMNRLAPNLRQGFSLESIKEFIYIITGWDIDWITLSQSENNLLRYYDNETLPDDDYPDTVGYPHTFDNTVESANTKGEFTDLNYYMYSEASGPSVYYYTRGLLIYIANVAYAAGNNTEVTDTKLYDGSKSWTPGAFIGKYLIPNVAVQKIFKITYNTSNMITVENGSNMTDYSYTNRYYSVVDERDAYKFFRIQNLIEEKLPPFLALGIFLTE